MTKEGTHQVNVVEETIVGIRVVVEKGEGGGCDNDEV